MADDLLTYADRVWAGDADLRPYYSGQLNREGLHRVADGVWMWPATGNVYVIDVGDALLLFDAGDRTNAQRFLAALRALTARPVSTLVYSHGHIDHVCGATVIDADPDRPVTVVGHVDIARRFDRYRLTPGYNALVNQRQFRAPGLTWPEVYRYPDRTYTDELQLDHGGLRVHLRHARGETDDATTAWIPDLKVLLCGDFYAWNAPNAGNPQKAQRHVAEWAATLEWMAGLGAELLLPGHGVPVRGAAKVARTLTDAATVLTHLHDATVDLMNAGATLDEILHSKSILTPTVKELLARPYLRPTYDDPEFILHNLWRAYGGWYEGDPAALRPAPRAELATEISELAGGPGQLAERALALLNSGNHRLAAHLVELAALAADDDPQVHRARAEVFGAMEADASSFMAKGIYGWAAAGSRARADGSDPWAVMRAGRWAP
ncbi:alkyl sulfatase dimerization domain-containing protein [Kineosporia sp. NBRC 101731]|uniref:alkyl sulfatase dimerization domain-containing protein n=1 Tax=Kineosporia sp. NBRC 101731 TaxID=3032199 RepID=UPI0024A3E660|nr:alkyl sulfatase dimerization domain-containing protein [Kineosporia sp. NBRC 101731]GLY30397.1 MBL fold metallo-hydrolase [Kineosporia sp. NBRC 101731]